MDTQYESSGIEKFFAGSNSLFQVSLAIGAFFYIAFITGLPHIVNIIAGLLGFIAFGALSILSNAYTHRHGIYNQYIDDGMKAAAHSKKAKSQLPIPPLKAFLIRSAIAWIIFIIGLAILLTIGFSVMAGSMAYIVPFTPDNEAMGRLISMIVTLPIVITGFGLIVGMYVVAPAIVDAAIYKNDLIIAHLYEEDEKPMTVGKFAKGMWTVLRASLGVGIGLSVILSLRVGLEFLDEADPPLYIFLPIIAVLIIAGLAFSWWSIKRQANHKTDELMQKMDQELIEQHGENSVEVQNFRIELDEYHALSEKEKKQLAKKDKDKEKPFSIVGQIYGGFPKVMIIGMFIACIGSIGLTFGAAQIGLQGEAIEAVGKLAFPLRKSVV